jgi:serine/threonine protein kinase
MASTIRPQPRASSHAKGRGSEERPLPLRTSSESGAFERSEAIESPVRMRHKSTRPIIGKITPLAIHAKDRRMGSNGRRLDAVSEAQDTMKSPQETLSTPGNVLTPPMTPQRGHAQQEASSPSEQSHDPEILPFDFSRLDYELDRARAIGEGLWSCVYLAQPVVKSPTQPKLTLTPPATPQSSDRNPPCSVFAVKAASRPDARPVFQQEGRTLTLLQRTTACQQHIVPFYGLDERNDCLVFEGVLGGSLDSLNQRLKVVTELERHLELRSLFPQIANDLVSGLEFIHQAGIVHADVKPANVLLDVSEDPNQHNLVIRARYIDFSASFVAGKDDATNAGGTWEYMAPEQISSRKDLNLPTFATDVWSLGITLLSIIAGGSPYRAACGDNLFMLRESIKSGDALGIARMDPIVQKRMGASQDFVDCCRLALQKDAGRRAVTTVWKRWVETEMTS